MRNIRTLDLNLLKALDALLDERNVTRAAARLALTQPAVSGLLTRLRESFDDPLFVRTQRGMVPTVRALELAGPVKRVLSEIDGLLRPVNFEPSAAQFTLSIAATDYAHRVIIVPFLSDLRRQAPRIKVAVWPIEDEAVPGQLERGDVDIALLTPEGVPPDCHSRHLFEEHYVCALREDHPDARGGSLTLERFCELDHALVSYRGERFWGVTDEVLAKKGRTREVVLSVASFLVLLEVLRTSDLIAVVPSKLVADAPGVTVLDPPIEIPGFTKVAAWHERTHHDPGHQWVRALLLETCQALGCHLHSGQERRVPVKARGRLKV